MQSDGNLVIYDASRRVAIWASGTTGHPCAFLAVQEDGNVVIYSSSRVPIWATDTACEIVVERSVEAGILGRSNPAAGSLRLVT
jgi:hypothetical protein